MRILGLEQEPGGAYHMEIGENIYKPLCGIMESHARVQGILEGQHAVEFQPGSNSAVYCILTQKQSDRLL